MNKIQDRCPGGRWWEDRWWVSSKFEHEYSEQEIEEAVTYLRDYFPASWVQEQLNVESFHPIFRYLCAERGVRAERFLVQTARMIRCLGGSSGFGKKLAELKTEKYYGISLELYMAEILADEGMAIEFPKEGFEKTPDIVARAGDEVVAVECKRLQREDRDEWQSFFMMQVIESMPTSFNGVDIVAKIDLDAALSDVLFGQRYKDLNKAILVDLAKQMRNHVDKALSANVQLPHQLNIPSIANVVILKKDLGVFGSVGIPISLTAKFRRVLDRGLFEAVEQLEKWPLGIAVVYTDNIPEPLFARTIFDAVTRARNDVFRNLLCLVVLPAQYLFYSYQRPLLLPNAARKEQAESSVAFRAFVRHLNP
ncbi:MAG: hypothetical protein WBM28_03275, partial [Burkholderiales bacterium]